MTANPTPPTVGRPLTETERTMLRYALDQAQEQMLCVGDEFSEDDHAAIDSLRRLADEPAPAGLGVSATPSHTELAAANREAADLAKHVTRAIFSLKAPAPSGSEHYRSGWDDGLEAAIDAAREEVLRRLADEAQQQPEPSVHGESIAHLAGLHDEPDDTLHACPGRWGGPDCRCFDDEPAVDARQDGEA